jgi:hypothetical protein
MRIDGQDPAISFDLPFLKNGIKQADIIVNGSVTAIRFDDAKWLCNKSRYLTVSQSSAPLRQFCPMGQASFCQCSAPASVFGNNNGYLNTEPKCNAPNSEKGNSTKRSCKFLLTLHFQAIL